MAFRATIDNVSLVFPIAPSLWAVQVGVSVFDDTTLQRIGGVSTQATFAFAASSVTIKNAIANQVKADALTSLNVTLGQNSVLFTSDFSVQ